MEPGSWNQLTYHGWKKAETCFFPDHSQRLLHISDLLGRFSSSRRSGGEERAWVCATSDKWCGPLIRGCTNYAARAFMYSRFVWTRMIAWVEGNVTSHLLHLDRRAMVGFKSKCYKFGTVSKPSHRSDPDQRSGGDPTGSHPRIHYCMCVLNLRFSIEADLITLLVPFHSYLRLLQVLLLLSTSKGTKLYARLRI